MANALYRKWRPQGWDEVVGQEHVVQTLRNAVLNDRVAHAYLFAGPRGTGKTSSARLLAKAANCLEPDLSLRPCNQCQHCEALMAGRFMDLIEIDAASNTSVDDIRDLRDKINFSPTQGKYKVYIIDEVHMLSTAAFNALLKTLEEPPPHAIFILATTEIHKIPATVLSRCQRHEFRRIPLDIIVQHLQAKSQEEGIQVEAPVFTEIARQATGSLRDAISLLDQLASTNEKVTLAMAQTVLGTATSLRVIEIVDALLQKDPARGLTEINKALDGGADPRQLARQIVTYLRNILLSKMGNDQQVEVSDEAKPKLFEHGNLFTMPELLRAIEAFNTATEKEQANWHPGLALELAFTEFLAEPSPVSAVSAAPTAHREPRENQPQQSKSTSIEIQAAPPKKASSKPTRAPQSKPIEGQAKPQPGPTPEEPESQEAAPTPSAKTGTISLSDVQKSWGKIKSQARKHNPRTQGLLNSATVTAIKDNTVVLGFKTEILKEMMEKEGNLVLTADILEEVLGQPMHVRCIVTSQEDSDLPDDDNIEKDGMVSTATRDLGGKITRSEDAE